MASIRDEARILSKMSSDLDNMREHYKTDNEIFIFPSPEILVLQKNLFFLQRYSKLINLKPKYLMRPDYLSYDKYGTVVLWPVLLFVNNIDTLEDFISPNVIVPDFTAIVDCLRDNIPEKKIEELLGVDL